MRPAPQPPRNTAERVARGLAVHRGDVLRCGVPVCPQCESGVLISRHCKRLCERCGYVESCEDNFPPRGDVPGPTG